METAQRGTHAEHPFESHADHAAHGACAESEPGHGGHDKHEGHSPEMFRDRLWVSLVLTVPILYLSAQLQDWFGYRAASFPGSEWVSPVLSTALFFYAGSVFLTGARHELADRRPGMMTLVSIAISVAYFYSLSVSLGLDGKPFYWELATLLDVMLLGHWMEMRSVESASSALDDLAAMIPAKAHRIGPDGSITDVPVAEIGDGDAILIRPGEQVPIDGVVTEGASSMNEAFLTGESRPVSKQPEDEVYAGAVNSEGSLTVTATRTGQATTLSQMMRLVEDAQASRSRFQVLADRAAFWLTVIAVGVAVPTFALWAIFGDSGIAFAVGRTVTVLVVACPHALGLAIPLVNMNATSISARNGILVRNREAFERGRNIDFVAFDKTGTLTEGRFVVADVASESRTEHEILSAAASLERASEHPLAAAIVEAAEDSGAGVPAATSVSAMPGQGVEGTVDGAHLRIGRPEWARELGVELGPELAAALARADERGESAVVLMAGDQALGVIALADKIRGTARHAIARLHELGFTPVMITGDAEAVARSVASELGIQRVYARVLPDEKARIVGELQSEGRAAFIGDGINDAPALLEADLGIAIGAGANVAVESADLVLVEDDPSDVTRALALSRATHRKMVQNLAWATGYNTVAIPLAAGVASSAGILLSPAIGALAMSLSTVIVAVNAMLIRRVDLDS